MSMKISLFDADDLKAFEDLLFRAMVRTARVLKREGLIADYGQPTASAPPPQQPSFLRGPPEKLVQAAETVFRQNGQMPEPQRPPEMPAATPPPPPVREVERLTPEQWAAQAKPPERAKRRSAAQVCRSMQDKPQGGWIRTDEAAQLMANGSDLDQERARTMLGQWILDEQVAGVIVTGTKEPPTKGLPGRLYVKREDVIRRDKQRQENAAMMPGARAMAERRKQLTAAA